MANPLHALLFFAGVIGGGLLFWGLLRLQERHWLSGSLLCLLGGLVAFFGPLSLTFEFLR